MHLKIHLPLFVVYEYLKLYNHSELEDFHTLSYPTNLVFTVSKFQVFSKLRLVNGNKYFQLYYYALDHSFLIFFAVLKVYRKLLSYSSIL